jgi:hypothetical protein
MLRHHAALVSGKLTRGPSGVNLPPSEVIMSRLKGGDTFNINLCDTDCSPHEPTQGDPPCYALAISPVHKIRPQGLT